MIVYGSSGLTAATRSAISPASRAAAALAQLVERDRALGRLDRDDLLELRQLVADGDDLRHLRGVLADDEARLGVAGDPRALLGRVGRVDRDDDAAGGRDREVRVRPLDAGRAQQGDAVARPQPEIHEPAGDLRDRLAELACRTPRATRRRA